MAVAGCPDYFLHHPNYQVIHSLCLDHVIRTVDIAVNITTYLITLDINLPPIPVTVTQLLYSNEVIAWYMELSGLSPYPLVR